MLLSIITSANLELDQLDVKTTFLYGRLNEKIYMDQSKGFEDPGKGNMVCLLKESLYGLKQSRRCWYRRFDKYVTRFRFQINTHYSCVFQRFSSDVAIYLIFYIDDILVASRGREEIKHLILG